MERFAGVVWKDGWLGHSETFVRDQLDSLHNWDFIKLGFHRTSDPLVEPDYAPYSNDVVSRNLRKALGTTPFNSQYKKRIENSDATILYAHFLSGGLNTATLALNTGLPLFTTLHNSRISFAESGLSSSFRPIYERRLQKVSKIGTKFLAVSSYVADKAIMAGLPADKVEVHHIGTRIVPPVPSDNRNGIIFVGRLIEMKGARDLLDAVDKLPEPLRSTPITIVGDGAQRGSLEESAKKIKLNVTFLGWKPSSELPKLLSQHEIFCGPSKADAKGVREGFGMVFLEAALQELACVAYRSGGVSDAVSADETGILVEEGNIDQLSAALEILLNNRATSRELGVAGRLRVEKDFDLNVQSDKLHEIFRSV